MKQPLPEELKALMFFLHPTLSLVVIWASFTIAAIGAVAGDYLLAFMALMSCVFALSLRPMQKRMWDEFHKDK